MSEIFRSKVNHLFDQMLGPQNHILPIQNTTFQCATLNEYINTSKIFQHVLKSDWHSLKKDLVVSRISRIAAVAVSITSSFELHVKLWPT